MNKTNKHGLPRYIKEDIRHRVRTRCGFGCIFCGRAIIQYHHFDPSFEDAVEHRAEGITLLCGYCHDKTSKGLISPVAVVKANASPACKRIGYAKDDLFFESHTPRVRLGGCDFFCQYPVVYGNELVLGFDFPEERGAPLRLQATIYGSSGLPILRIIDNEWRAGTELFDVITTANRLEIRETGRPALLELDYSSDRGLSIQKLNMTYKDCSVVIEGTRITLQRGGTISFDVGSLVAEAGAYFPVGGGSVLGASGIPFLTKPIADFDPVNDLEKAFVLHRNGQPQREAFYLALQSSEVFVLEERDSPQLTGQMKVTLLGGALVVLTAEHRMDPIRRWVTGHGEPRAISFSALRQGMQMNEIWLNPYSPVTTRLPATIINSLR